MKSRHLLRILFTLALPAAVHADWRQFRGPDATGATSEAGAAPSKLAVAWSAELPGRGLSSPIVLGDKVFVTAASGPKQDRLHLFCFNTVDGKKIWERQLRATGRTMCQEKTCVAAPTPCTDGTSVFIQYSSNDVAAFDLKGNLFWFRGLTSDYPNASNSLGMASSLVVAGGTLVVMVENDSESFTAGLDVKTGVNRWKLSRPKAANWTSPVLFQNAVALQSSKGLLGIDPATGSPLWNYEDGASTIPSSAASGEVLFVPSRGLTALKPGKSGGSPEQLWRVENMNPATASPLVLGDRVYIVNGTGVLQPADVKTGERFWKLRLAGPASGSPVGAGTSIVFAAEKGVVQLIDTTAPEGAVAAEVDLKETLLCTPALSGGAAYVRSDKHLWKLN